MLQITRGALARGFRVVGISPGGGAVSRAFRDLGAEALAFHVGRSYDVLSGRRLAAFLRAAGAEVAQTHGVLPNLAGRYAAGLFGGPPVVSTVHGPLGLPAGWRRSYYGFLERTSAPWAAGIVAVSRAVRADLEAMGVPPARVVVIPNGIPALPEDPAPVARVGERLELVVVARLSAPKDVATVLAACAALPAGLAWRLRVAGEGPEREDLERRAHDLGITARVEFLGRIEAVEALLAEADVFVSASRKEGLPIALLEAMRAGLPAALVEDPGTLEAAVPGQSALVSPPGDGPAMAASIRRLGEDVDLRRTMGEAARARWAEAFCGETMVARHLELLEALLAEVAAG